MPAIPLPEYRRYLHVIYFPDQRLNCFVLESSRMLFVKFPKLSLFQISERLQVLCYAFELKVLICGLG
jgi:hypothetical protein